MKVKSTQAKPLQKIYFWGVRGTMPSPYKKCLNSGGHTSCVELNAINYDGTQAQILIDAGTGLVPAGDALLREGVRDFTIYLSHFHYDHVFGLTKFSPLFRSDCKIKILAVKRDAIKLIEIFERFFSYPFFPINFNTINKLCKIDFIEVNPDEKVSFNGLELTFHPLNHPQECYALKSFHPDSKTTLVYATDTEHESEKDLKIIDFFKNSNLLIYDSTFHSKNYGNHVGWGHSTGVKGAELAKISNCENFFLFHHDYGCSDQILTNLNLKETRKIFKNSYLAKEGYSFILRNHDFEKQIMSKSYVKRTGR